MDLKDFPPGLTDAGRRAWTAIVAEPTSALICSDFDGVLSPIVLDPDQAWAAEETVGGLARLGSRVGKVAVVTGRLARKAVELGRLDQRPGLESMSVFGLYGFERWDAETGEFHEPHAPEGVAAAHAELPGLLARLGLGAARVEDKRLSLGVHTRELPNRTPRWPRSKCPFGNWPRATACGSSPASSSSNCGRPAWTRAMLSADLSRRWIPAWLCLPGTTWGMSLRSRRSGPSGKPELPRAC